jgi:hypothetical protein
MIRLHVTAEGQTEKGFVENVLRDHLAQFGVYTDVRCVLTGRDNRSSKEYRGGMTTYLKAKRDIRTWIQEDGRKESRFTTMFDLYSLPNDFPGVNEAKRAEDPYDRARAIETGMAVDFSESPSFIPYIQLHEFEALILADPQKLGMEYFGRDKEITELAALMKDANPELINGGQDTAPSKRILKLIPEYNKVTAGKQIAKEIGINMLREKCRHFHEWLSKLEGLDRGK